MPRFEHFRTASLVLTCAFLFGAKDSSAQKFSQGAATWWPDPNTGLMWTGEARHHLNWQQAGAYCLSLKLGGYSDWRLPTANEVGGIYHCEMPQYQCHDIAPEYMVPNGTLWDSEMQQRSKSVRDGFADVLCTRTMDPEVLQIAKDAQVGVTVSDVKTLEAFVPLNKAKLAYQAGQFQESIAQARNTLALLPNLPTALWAIGISYGRLGQWDMAVSHLQAALKADKSYADAKDGLKWAKNGQKAAMDRKTSTIQAPRWN